MKKIIFGAMAAVALLACSKDQVIEQNRANDEITFSVVAENQTRAAAVYCANNLLPEFNVAATYTKEGTTQWYFQNDNIEFVEGAWVNQTTTRYWADGGTLDFYAIYNGTMNMTAIDGTPAAPTVDFKPDTDVTKQLDLLYAVTTGKTKSSNAVELNFRHALSQIEFKAKNTNQQLHVEITGVRVGQTPGTGVFTYPSVNTDDKFVDHEQAGNLINYTTGTWTSSNPADYTATFTTVPVKGDSNPVGLTLSTDASGETRDFANSMLLIPAKTTAWAPEDGTTYDGSYLAVNCNIYNVAGSSYVPGSDICLHTGWAVIPVAFDWQPGKKYIYTFVFGEGNGGYEDDPENPEPVLTPISYTVTVDDFQKGVDSDVQMKY